MPRHSRRKPPTDTATENTAAAAPSGQRLDHWLWCARLTKTRGEATRLILDGAVRINRMKVQKPATRLSIGDVVSLFRHQRLFVCRVLGFHPRRVGPREAARLREDV